MITHSDLEELGYITTPGFASHHGVDCIVCICPSCDDKSGHLYVNTVTGFCYCWKCSHHFILKLDDPFEECTYYEVASKPAMDYQSQMLAAYSNAYPLEQTSPLVEVPLMYLRSRGISWKLAQALKIRYSLSDPLCARILIPAYDGETLIYWVARSYTGMLPPYYNPPGVTVKQQGILYLPQLGEGHTGVIVEGVFDAIAVSRIPGFVGIATYGKQISEEQFKNLAGLVTWGKFQKLYYLPDTKGIEAREIQKVLKRLQADLGTSVKVVEIQGYKDAGETPLKILQGFLHQPKQISEWRP